MKNFIQDGDFVSQAAPYTVVAGAGVLVGGVFGVAVDDAASGASVVLAREGVFDLLCVTANTFNAGDPVYWDNSAKSTTSTVADNTLVGYALAAKTNAQTTVRVLLNQANGFIRGGTAAIVGGVTALDGSNPTPVVTGLTTVTGFAATLTGSAAPGVGTSVLTYIIASGTVNVYAWKPTSNSDPTLVASTGTETFAWIAVGT